VFELFIIVYHLFRFGDSSDFSVWHRLGAKPGNVYCTFFYTRLKPVVTKFRIYDCFLISSCSIRPLGVGVVRLSVDCILRFISSGFYSRRVVDLLLLPISYVLAELSIPLTSTRPKPGKRYFILYHRLNLWLQKFRIYRCFSFCPQAVLGKTTLSFF